MLYFFHHYELPAILHQARVQDILRHTEQEQQNMDEQPNQQPPQAENVQNNAQNNVQNAENADSTDNNDAFVNQTESDQMLREVPVEIHAQVSGLGEVLDLLQNGESNSSQSDMQVMDSDENSHSVINNSSTGIQSQDVPGSSRTNTSEIQNGEFNSLDHGCHNADSSNTSNSKHDQNSCLGKESYTDNDCTHSSFNENNTVLTIRKRTVQSSDSSTKNISEMDGTSNENGTEV